jgi:hypothetical protein
MPNRVYYASKKAGIAPLGSNVAGGGGTGAVQVQTIRGLQSIGVTTTFNLEQVFEIGQLAIYENIEGIPDVSVELEKVLDGYSPIYTLATQLGTGPSLSGRSNGQCHLVVSIHPDTNDQAANSQEPNAEMQMSGMFCSAVSYSATVDGNATESVTMVGNDKVWVGLVPWARAATYLDDPFVNNEDFPISIGGSGGVQRREDVLFVYPGERRPGRRGYDINGAVSGDGTVLPIELPGISVSGTNDKIAGGAFGAHIQNISISTDLGREEIFELGRRGRYHRYVTFPIEVTTEIGMISVSGDLISATEEGTTAGTGACPAGTNLQNSTIRLHMCEGLQVDAGIKNKLASVGVTGGDTGGGNEEITYTYTNFNDFTVYHPNDPRRGGIVVDGEGVGTSDALAAYDADFDPKTFGTIGYNGHTANASNTGAPGAKF